MIQEIEDSDSPRFAQRWFGLGNLRANCWFVGMELGGTDHEQWPGAVPSRFGGAATIDLQEATGAAERRRLGLDNALHPTWSPLIRMRLAYGGYAQDEGALLTYQRDRFCRHSGGEALLEISERAARHAKHDAARDRICDERVAHLRKLVADYEPEAVICYGTSYRQYFETLCGGAFDPDGFRWSGTTLCVLARHPKPQFRAPEPAAYWANLGAEMKRRVTEHRGLR